jgi:hypothetical protein
MPEAPTDDYLYEAGPLVVIPGWSAGPGPEAMNTGFAHSYRPVCMGSGLAGHARAPE